MTVRTFRAFRIHRDDGRHAAGLETMAADALSPGEVLVKVAYSSLNYKDALAGTGKGRILRQYPLNGGIDAAGHVVESGDARFKPGDAVLCTGSGLSETRDGGLAEYVRLAADSTIALPSGLTLRESMIIGTAGFTAALALLRMQANGQTSQHGPIAITGASGGVGTLGIDIFSRAGYTVHAISGKHEQFDWLQMLGAETCIDRHELTFSGKPMDSARFGGALDTVGGDMLAGLLPLISGEGNVALCGNAGGMAFSSTVMPFIIRGVSLLGIGSAGTARATREKIWHKLAGEWKPRHLDAICTHEVTLDNLDASFERMLAGQSHGRTLVAVDGTGSALGSAQTSA
jgi:putative YhdH/YhfP family quinone oxidoreductase